MTRSLRSARAAANGSGLNVAVTGAASQVGQVVCRRLAAADAVRSVVALDLERPNVPGVRWRQTDPTDPGLATALRRIDVLIDLAVAVDPELDRDEQRRRTTMSASVALTAAAATGVKHVVLLSSARVYGANAENPVPLPEDAPVLANGDGSQLGDLLEVEAYARRASKAYPQLKVAVLRPALLIGPGLDHEAAGLLDGPRLLVVKGTRMRWQFCHVDDLAAATETVVTAGLSGPITVGSDGWMEQEELEEILGRRRVELPADLAFSTAARLHAIGVTADPASQLRYLMYPWVIGAEQLRTAGWEPAYSNAEALATYAKGRPIVPRRRRITAKSATAAAGAAAGATVALVGTAALVRRARRRRRT
jgi:nucleoside-diphosphate-sugar epimerase